MARLGGPQFLNAPILLLREGTDVSQGIPQIVSNINACLAIVDMVRSTLGPRGMDKLIHTGSGFTITNDGATVLDLLNVSHPAARVLVDIAKAQDEEVGDGTTSVTVFAGELLSAAKDLLSEGMQPQTIARGFQLACSAAVARINEIRILIGDKPEAERRALLEKCASTSLNSKLLCGYKDLFGKMAVDAVTRLDQSRLDRRLIGIKKVSGGSVTESQLIDGVAFKKTFSYAGFEQQPKKFKNPKVLLLNVELELKAEKENAEVRISNSDEYQRVVDAEWTLLTNKLETAVNSGAKVVLSRLPIGDLATQYFADHDVFCAGRVEEADLTRTAMATGGRIQTTLGGGALSPEVLGTCETFEEVQIGNERFNMLLNGSATKTVTLILRGGAEQFINEAERSLNDAIEIVRRTIQTKAIVGGAGSTEMHLSSYLRDVARQETGKVQLAMSKFAAALEVIPHTLAVNSGLDPISVVNSLRRVHAEKNGAPQVWTGVDCFQGGLFDAVQASVWEPALVKSHAISAATEAACTILLIDETIKNAKSNPDPLPQPAFSG